MKTMPFKTLLAVLPLLWALPALADDWLDKPGVVEFRARWDDPSSYAQDFGTRWHYTESLRQQPPAQRQSPNLKSAALRLRAWASPAGDFFATREFVWELNDTVLTGSTPRKTVAVSKLAKYPSLLRRMQNLRPTRVDAVIDLKLRNQACMDKDALNCQAGRLYFRFAHQSVHVPASRSMETIAPPASPTDWRRQVSTDPDPRTRFGEQDRSSVEDMRKLMARPVYLGDGVAHQQRLVDLKLEWPLAEIDKIIELYERYEKEDKKLEDDFALIQPAYKPAGLPAPYAKSDELATPYEEEIKTAEAFADKQGVGLRAKGRVVMQSAEHQAGTKLDAEGRYWVFQRKAAPYKKQVYDARGKLLSVAGEDSFDFVLPGGRSGSYRLALVDFTRTPAYATVKDYYRNGPGQVMSLIEFQSFRTRDGDGKCRESSLKAGQVGIHLGQRSNIYRGRLIEVDERFTLVGERAGYFPNGRPRAEVGQRICDGG